MKVCIPFTAGDIGGTSIFMRKFVKGLEGKGIEVTTTVDDDYDLTLVIADYSRSFDGTVLEKKKKGVKVVQRLDGVMTFATSRFLFPVQNYRMKYVLHNIADYIIYQSRYCKFLCDRYLGKPKCPWSIVYNGVDIQQFSPEGERYRPANAQFTLLTVSRFSRKMTLWPLIRAMEHIKRELSNVQLLLIGPIRYEFQKMIPKSDSFIKYIGQIPNEEVPFYERGADAFVFPIRSASPNVLLESIACGLPVACYDTGSNREILGDNEAGVLAAPGLEGKLCLYYMKMPDSKKLAEAALRILFNPEPYKKAARKRAVELFSLDRMVDEYIQVFKQVLNKP